MNNHELLNIIGEVNEDYVLAADSGEAHPRFRWQTLAACAACAALIVAAYPAWQALSRKPASGSIPSLEEVPEASRAPIQRPGLHEYTLVEGDEVCAMTTEGSAKVPSDDLPDPIPEPGGGFNAPAGAPAAAGGEADGTTDAVGSDAAVQEEASAQYERLLRSMGVYGQGEPACPDWFGGVWLDGEYLTVAIVDGFRTPELEKQILGWCGGTGEILFADVKYSQNHLDGLMDEIGGIFDELDCRVFSSYGVYPDNRIHLDFFEMPGDEVLAALAELDPDGSAIYIQVFPGVRSIPTDGAAKGPALAEPSIEAEPTPVPVGGSAAAAEPSVPPAP